MGSVVIPMVGQKDPGQHNTGATKRLALQNDPTGHTRGSASKIASAAGQKKPTGQGDGVTVPTGQYEPGLHAEQVVLLTAPYVLTEQRDTPAKERKSRRESKAHADETHKKKKS